MPTVQDFLLPQPGDSVEFCPHPDAQNIFACGTYQLEQSDERNDLVNTVDNETLHPSKPVSQRRQGRCLVFELQSDSDPIKL
jgi:diphthamide biosynthesis protein 7